MKSYKIENKTLKEVMNDLPNHFSFNHYIGGKDGAVEVIVDDRETYLDTMGLKGEPYDPEKANITDENIRLRETASERLQLKTTISIPRALNLGKDVVLPISGKISYDSSIVSYLLVSASAEKTVFEIELDMSVDFPKDMTDDEWAEVLDRSRRLGFFAIWMAGCQPINFHPGFVLYNNIEPIVWKLACASDDVRFVLAFQETPMDKQVGPVLITCKGKSETIFFPENTYPGMSQGIYRSPRPLFSTEVQRCLSNPLQEYEIFCVLSDMEYPRYRIDIEVVLLATMLETEAYRTALRIRGEAEKYFNPNEYFGENNYLSIGEPFFKQDPKSYAICHELWGARHEIAHNGRKKVRVFNGRHGVDKNNLRDLTAQDIRDFRSAALAAVEWMKNL